MKKLGLKYVRLAGNDSTVLSFLFPLLLDLCGTEFAWALMEPSEGVYEWEWLDRALEEIQQQGLQAVLGYSSPSLVFVCS